MHIPRLEMFYCAVSCDTVWHDTIVPTQVGVVPVGQAVQLVPQRVMVLQSTIWDQHPPEYPAAVSSQNTGLSGLQQTGWPLAVSYTTESTPHG